MYAIIESHGRQYTVREGEEIDLPRQDAEPGSEITFENVKLVNDDGAVQVGAPHVSGATVTATVVGEAKGAKVTGVSFRRRKGSKVKTGHRPRYTRVRITGLSA